MNVEHIFPIPIIKSSIREEIIDYTLELVNNYIEETNFLTMPADPGHLLTTFHDNKNFLGKLNDHVILDIINQRSREFLKTLGCDPKCFLEVTSWLQYHPPGSHFNKHEHYGAHISGVFYLQTPENCGDLLFYNPLELRRLTNVFFDKIKLEDNEYNYTHVRHTPKKGDLIMFEPWLTHSVEENKSNDTRISIAFNIWTHTDVKI